MNLLKLADALPGMSPPASPAVPPAMRTTSTPPAFSIFKALYGDLAEAKAQAANSNPMAGGYGGATSALGSPVLGGKIGNGPGAGFSFGQQTGGLKTG